MGFLQWYFALWANLSHIFTLTNFHNSRAKLQQQFYNLKLTQTYAKYKLTTIIHDPWLVWMSRFNKPTIIIIIWLTWQSQSKINTNKHPSYTNITRTSLLPSYNSQSLAELNVTFQQTHHYFLVHLAIVNITPCPHLLYRIIEATSHIASSCCCCCYSSSSIFFPLLDLKKKLSVTWWNVADPISKKAMTLSCPKSGWMNWEGVEQVGQVGHGASKWLRKPKAKIQGSEKEYVHTAGMVCN